MWLKSIIHRWTKIKKNDSSIDRGQDTIWLVVSFFKRSAGRIMNNFKIEKWKWTNPNRKWTIRRKKTMKCNLGHKVNWFGVFGYFLVYFVTLFLNFSHRNCPFWKQSVHETMNSLVAPSGRIVPLSERQQMALLKRIEEQRKQSTSPKPNDIQVSLLSSVI